MFASRRVLPTCQATLASTKAPDWHSSPSPTFPISRRSTASHSLSTLNIMHRPEISRPNTRFLRRGQAGAKLAQHHHLGGRGTIGDSTVSIRHDRLCHGSPARHGRRRITPRPPRATDAVGLSPTGLQPCRPFAPLYGQFSLHQSAVSLRFCTPAPPSLPHPYSRTLSHDSKTPVLQGKRRTERLLNSILVLWL